MRRPGKIWEIDFQAETGGRLLGNTGINASKINLGVQTGSLSRLLVLEVAKEEQKSSLDERGKWRSDCVAELGPLLEKHFYLLPPGFQFLWSSFLGNGVYFWHDGDITLLPLHRPSFPKALAVATPAVGKGSLPLVLTNFEFSAFPAGTCHRRF